MSIVPTFQPPRQRVERFRDKNYLKYVASHFCLACGGGRYAENPGDARTQAAHITVGRNGTDKPDDFYTIPLCAEDCNGCHRKFDAGQEKFARNAWDMNIDQLKAKALKMFRGWK